MWDEVGVRHTQKQKALTGIGMPMGQGRTIIVIEELS
jgi:hypothetical protein